MEHNLLTARLVKSVLLSEKTKHLEFEVEEVSSFDFLAGQFISVREPRGDKFVTRAYSIASPPRANNTFDLCLNRVDEGFMSNFLCDRELGDTARFHGPHGLFVLKPEVEDVIFVATGTGIAPFRSMVQHLFGMDGSGQQRHGGRQVWLVYGTRYCEDVYYKEEFESLTAEHPNFHYVATLSRAPADWTGNRGYVQEHVYKIVGSRKDVHVYICGLNEMVSSVRRLLIEECGWEKKRVIYERYD
ncbi:MAG: oxidoreductase [Acidobacteria bacterium]|nr:MAG: oxidoreductase [Acidobacteriota bacterium]